MLIINTTVPFINIVCAIIVQMNKRGLKVPTTDFVHRKSKMLDTFKNTSLKEEDVEMVRQKFLFVRVNF